MKIHLFFDFLYLYLFFIGTMGNVSGKIDRSSLETSQLVASQNSFKFVFVGKVTVGVTRLV